MIGVIVGDLAANEILGIRGIVNGTTNYILTKMEAEGWTYAQALAEAQRIAQTLQQLVGILRHRSTLVTDLEGVSIQLHFKCVTEADKGVASLALAAFDAFQQKTRPQ